MDDEQQLELRSRSSTEKVQTRFINLTTRNVEVVWINYSGQFVKYQLLERGNFIDINTYKSHPWIAFDSKTKDRLLLNGNFVYMPKPWRECAQEHFPHRSFPDNIEPRMMIKITIPLYSLRFRTLLEVRNCLKKPEDCDFLELPTEIKEDLKRSINQRNRVILTPILRIS